MGSSGFNYSGVLLATVFSVIFSLILAVPRDLCIDSGLIDLNSQKGFTALLAFYYLPHIVCGFFAAYLSRWRRIRHAFVAGLLYLVLAFATCSLLTIESGGAIPYLFLLPIVPSALVGGWLAPSRAA